MGQAPTLDPWWTATRRSGCWEPCAQSKIKQAGVADALRSNSARAWFMPGHWLPHQLCWRGWPLHRCNCNCHRRKIPTAVRPIAAIQTEGGAGVGLTEGNTVIVNSDRPYAEEE
jgi:hypothetical protein